MVEPTRDLGKRKGSARRETRREGLKD